MPKRGPEHPDSLLHWACSLKSTGVTLTSRERTVIRKVEQAQRNASRPPPAGFSSDEECEEAGIIYGCTDAEVTTAMETMKVLEEIKAIKTMSLKTPKDGDEGDEDHEGAGGPTASGSTQQALDVNDCDVNDCDVRSEREGGAMDNRLRRVIANTIRCSPPLAAVATTRRRTNIPTTTTTSFPPLQPLVPRRPVPLSP